VRHAGPHIYRIVLGFFSRRGGWCGTAAHDAYAVRGSVASKAMYRGECCASKVDEADVHHAQPIASDRTDR
jgi:hypothetical protein